MLKAPAPHNTFLAIAFGQWHRSDSDSPLGPEEARAFLRHVFNHFYHDFSNVDLKGITFIWQRTYLSALITFREAARRRGQSFTRLYANRVHTDLPCHPPAEELNRFPLVLVCPPGGAPSIHPGIDTAVESSRAALKAQQDGQ